MVLAERLSPRDFSVNQQYNEPRQPRSTEYSYQADNADDHDEYMDGNKARKKASTVSQQNFVVPETEPSLVERLIGVIDYVTEFIDMKACGHAKEQVGPGMYIRRGECIDELREHGAAGFMHCHIEYSSDGRMKPEDVVRIAFEKGAKIVAITDHVSKPESIEEASELYRGLRESFARAAKTAKKYGIMLVPGIEYNLEPCGYVPEDGEEGDVEVAAGHMGIYLPYDVDLKRFVKLLYLHREDTLADFIDFANDIRDMGGAVVANHVTHQDGIGERCLEHLVERGAVDGVEDVNLGAGMIMPYSVDVQEDERTGAKSVDIVPYSRRLGISSIAAQDSHGIPQASVATMFDPKKLKQSVEGFELNSPEYFAAASRELLRQIRNRETGAYFELDDFKFTVSNALEKFRLLHPVISTKLMLIGVTSPDLFTTFFGRALLKGRVKEDYEQRRKELEWTKLTEEDIEAIRSSRSTLKDFESLLEEGFIDEKMYRRIAEEYDRSTG